MKFVAAWVLARSAGVCASSRRLVEPVKAKFQPRPRIAIAAQKLITSEPASAITTLSVCRAMPMAITGIAPIRPMIEPVKNPGANMKKMCHSMTKAVEPNRWLAWSMASGVEVISRFITAWPTMAHKVATTKIGWRMICQIGRPPSFASAAVNFGILTAMTTKPLNNVNPTRNM